MILISHRGNTNERNPTLENNPIYLDYAIKNNFNIELDIWHVNQELWLGHDNPQYHIDISWLKNRINYLWIHCKNISSLLYFKNQTHLPFNFFWHENDTLALTSLGFIWAYPGKQPIQDSIAVMPELNNDNLKQCIGVCSDVIAKYKSNYYDQNNYF